MPGTLERAPPPGAPTRCDGGFIFAEAPHRTALEARIIWCAALDPGTLGVEAVATHTGDPDAIRVAEIEPWLTIAIDAAGAEYAVLSDGWRRIRLDIEAGRLSGLETVLLRYRLFGTGSADSRVLPLRRLLHLCRHRQFARSLFPSDPRTGRWLMMLRVHDALMAGASQREIGAALFGEERVRRDWHGPSDSLRSRVRRLVREARAMAQGGYRQLLGRGR